MQTNKMLNYRFHNPNAVAETADYLLKIFIEANEEKAETALQEAAIRFAEQKGSINGNTLAE